MQNLEEKIDSTILGTKIGSSNRNLIRFSVFRILNLDEKKKKSKQHKNML
jgi:hypothetical protein